MSIRNLEKALTAIDRKALSRFGAWGERHTVALSRFSLALLVTGIVVWFAAILGWNYPLHPEALFLLPFAMNGPRLGAGRRSD